jgi:hypothetical protein
MNVNRRDAILDQARMRLEINRPADPWSGLFIHLRAVACFAPKPASIRLRVPGARESGF